MGTGRPPFLRLLRMSPTSSAMSCPMAEAEEPIWSPKGLMAVEREEERGRRERETAEDRWGGPLEGRWWWSGVRKVCDEFSFFIQRRG